MQEADRMTVEEYRAQHDSRKNPYKQMQGKQNRYAGACFEEIINASCVYYDRQNIAYVEKTPEPMAPIRRMEQNRFVAVFTEKAQCDYKGTYSGGQAIAFEAKHTSKDRIMQVAVTPRQWGCLDRQEAMGAWCFVLVSIKTQDFFRVPWGVWKGMKRYFGRKYLTADDMEPFRVPQEGSTVLFLDRYGETTVTLTEIEEAE